MHESHTLIIKEEDEGEEVLKKFIKNTEEFWMMRKIPRSVK